MAGRVLKGAEMSDHLEKIWYKHPPEFGTPEEELDYCDTMLTAYKVPDDVWIGTTGTRVADRLAWLMRRFHLEQFPREKETNQP